ncbi:Lachesin, partial [Stegodyphus mimosarum]
MCQLNTAPMISQTRHLEVVVPPSINEKQTSSDQNVREGADVNLRCNASGSPKPTIKWRREDDKDIILGSKRVPSIEGEFLKLKRTSRLSMGAYLCIASNGVLPSVSKRIMLNVLFAPMILIPSQLIGASTGEDVTLVCNLESYPRSVTYWVIARDIVIITNNKYKVMYEPSDLPASYKTKMKLLIRDLRPQDFGSYTCVAKNSLGETEGTIKLYEKPRLGIADSTEYHYTETKVKENEITSEEIRPVADNIKLERKEPRQETERQQMKANIQHTAITKIDELSPSTSATFEKSLFIIAAYSAYLLHHHFVRYV